MADVTYEAGRQVRREVLGADYVQAAEQRTTDFTRDFQELLTRFAWGGVWIRPGLDRRTRSLITVAMLVALGREEELELHVRAALRNGVTTAELREVLIHSAAYCGLPAANSAFRVAERALEP
ncbi:MAG: 4-carboxymuconolactone decarboxylase [Candidatus Dormibacteraeota bacterium]|nr:4-carboxymuconolactone decarboxylase [Candidatus Dormibacteraeota bacterium]